jgi:hypothetical protein
MNVIGPFNSKREPHDEWDEIICNNRSIYYYFKKGTYYSCSGPPSFQEPGWEWYQIGNNNYMVEVGDVDFHILSENSNFSEIIMEICSEATAEKFDVNIPIDFDNIKSFKEVFEIVIQKPKELFNLIEYIIHKINSKIITKQIEKNDLNKELVELLSVFNYINFEPRFGIIKHIISMLNEEVINIGPVNYQIPINKNKWNEIKCDEMYYYVKK